MRNFIEITDYHAKELDAYVRLTGAQLRQKAEPEKGIFIAESPTVIEVAMKGGCVPVSLLVDKRLLNGDAQRVIDLCEERTPGLPIYFATRELLAEMTGFELTRGMLCAMKRPLLPTLETLCEGAKRVAVLEGIVDATNIGAIFRSAAGIGIDAVLLTPTCCDPLNRRSVRVSMGTILQVPWGYLGESKDDWPHPMLERLKALGFKTAAMALSDDSVPVDDERLGKEAKLAIVLGTEGDGLSHDTIASCDYTVKIPMLHGVDSLNVAAASAVAFWQLRAK